MVYHYYDIDDMENIYNLKYLYDRIIEKQKNLDYSNLQNSLNNINIPNVYINFYAIESFKFVTYSYLIFKYLSYHITNLYLWTQYYIGNAHGFDYLPINIKHLYLNINYYKLQFNIPLYLTNIFIYSYANFHNILKQIPYTIYINSTINLYTFKKYIDNKL